MMILLCFLSQFIFSPVNVAPQEKLQILVSDTVKYQIFEIYEALQEEAFTAEEDEILLVNFWATWCAPCIKEIPYFEEINKEGQVKVILVSLDFTDQLEKRLVPFVEKHKLTSDLYVLADMDANKWIDMVDPSWSGTIPATLAISGSKRLFTDKEFQSVSEIKSFIKQLYKN